jgi:hypothetical protein
MRHISDYFRTAPRDRTDQIFREKDFWIALVPLELFASKDTRAHPSPTREHSLQRLEPKSIGIPSLVVVLAQRHQAADHSLAVCAVVPVDQEDQDVQEKPSSRQVRGVQSRSDVGDRFVCAFRQGDDCSGLMPGLTAVRFSSPVLI